MNDDDPLAAETRTYDEHVPQWAAEHPASSS